MAFWYRSFCCIVGVYIKLKGQNRNAHHAFPEFSAVSQYVFSVLEILVNRTIITVSIDVFWVVKSLFLFYFIDLNYNT